MTPEEWIDCYVERTLNGRSPRFLVGMCSVASREMCEVFPDLKPIPGWVYDAEGYSLEHVWCVDSEGRIYDPTVKQFNSKVVRYEAWEPGGSVYTGKCFNCGCEIYRSVESLDNPVRDYCCGAEECLEGLDY